MPVVESRPWEGRLIDRAMVLLGGMIRSDKQVSRIIVLCRNMDGGATRIVEVEDRIMTSVLSGGDARDPFPESGLDALLETASRDCPDAILMRDDDGASTAEVLARRVDRLAGLLRLAGLAAGETVLLVAGAQTSAFVALVAVLKAGLAPVMVSCGSGAVEIAAFARIASAVALIGPTRYGTLDLGETYLSAAAIADTIRLIATQGPEDIDGALDVSAARLDQMAGIPSAAPRGSSADVSMISTFALERDPPELVAHRQAALFADALSLVEQARVNPSKRIVSTLAPTSRAGLVAGPFAALIGAAGLILHGPFDAARFLAACDGEPSCHVVVPASVGAEVDSALSAGLGSLILVSRFSDAQAFVLPRPIASNRPVVDVYSYGEKTLLSRHRVDGLAREPDLVSDTSQADGLGAKLNRARAETRLQRDGA